jgi:FAD/FMN-containing dehydrogenase
MDSRQAALSDAAKPTRPPRVDQAFIDELIRAAGPGSVLSGSEVAERSAGFLRPDKVMAEILVRPATPQGVAATLALCHRSGQRTIVHGGLTGLVHGADTTQADLVLSLERMTKIEEIDPVERIAVVQAGVTLQRLQDAVQARDLAFPLDLGARGSATIGGMISTNAGGNRVIRYGMMRDMTLGLEAVLANGTIVSSMNRMIKNNAGYDLKQLFIGSEGTLGVVTRAVLKLRERPSSEEVAFVAVPDFGCLGALLKHMDRELGGALSAFEVMWSSFYDLVTTAPATNKPPVAKNWPYYVLVESHGADATRDAERFEAALASAMDKRLVAEAVIARSGKERSAIWSMRDDVAQTLRYGIPFIFDVSLPIPAMEPYVNTIAAELARRWPGGHFWVFGHLGDGNLHLVIRPDAVGDVRAEVEHTVYEPLREIGGSISAEHGIGLEKKPYLGLTRGPAEVALMRALKATLDPEGLLNPGRII